MPGLAFDPRNAFQVEPIRVDEGASRPPIRVDPQIGNCIGRRFASGASRAVGELLFDEIKSFWHRGVSSPIRFVIVVEIV